MSAPDPVMGAMMEAAVTGIEGFKSSVGYGELEAIVRDLAATEPLSRHGEPTLHGEWEECALCEQRNDIAGQPVKHRDCAWWNAAAWVLDHPVSGDQQ